MGKSAKEIPCMIQDNVVRPRTILPNLDTTTDEDKSVASIIIIGTLQAYVEHMAMLGCGFPSVNLLGGKSERKEIRCRDLTDLNRL